MPIFKVFTDESGLTEQYLGLGGIFIEDIVFWDLENRIEEYANDNGYRGREFSYKKCKKTNIDRYIGLVELFFNFIKEMKPKYGDHMVDFRCKIINTTTNELQRTEKSEEEGFYKFYHTFISASLGSLDKKGKDFELNVADKPDAYKYRTEILQSTIGGNLKAQFGEKCTLSEIERGNPKNVRVHQLADVLLGAVTYRFNNRDSDNKRAYVNRIEELVGKRLTDDFKPYERPFNVWAFASRGQKRWVDGATGVV